MNIENEENIIKNTRSCFVNEEIKIQIYIFNPLFKDIELTDCRVVIIGKNAEDEKQFVFTP